MITVAKVRGGAATPVGVFVVHGGNGRWVPAVDTNRIALIGVITGLISAVLASVAVLRRPPWPDLSATSSAWLRADRLRPVGDADRAEHVFRWHVEGQRSAG